MWDLKGAEINIRFLKDTTHQLIIIKTKHKTTTPKPKYKKEKIDKKEKKQ